MELIIRSVNFNLDQKLEASLRNISANNRLRDIGYTGEIFQRQGLYPGR